MRYKTFSFILLYHRSRATHYQVVPIPATFPVGPMRPATAAAHREDVLIAGLVGAVGAVALEGEVVLGVGRVDVLDRHAPLYAPDSVTWRRAGGGADQRIE